MAEEIKFNWSRLDMEMSDMDGLTDVVTHMVVGLSATHPSGRKYYMDKRCSLQAPDAENFIPASDLNKEWQESVAESLTVGMGFKEKLNELMTENIGKSRYGKNLAILNRGEND